mmetsp:Transcript_72817/g.159056  ORF Transcript_72817/g.159056 Transcript_72817/m.159056 type:complete len:232 (-) Transcript_72817:505-1200(-)
MSDGALHHLACCWYCCQSFDITKFPDSTRSTASRASRALALATSRSQASSWLSSSSFRLALSSALLKSLLLKLRFSRSSPLLSSRSRVASSLVAASSSSSSSMCSQFRSIASCPKTSEPPPKRSSRDCRERRCCCCCWRPAAAAPASPGSMVEELGKRVTVGEDSPNQALKASRTFGGSHAASASFDHSRFERYCRKSDMLTSQASTRAKRKSGWYLHCFPIAIKARLANE